MYAHYRLLEVLIASLALGCSGSHAPAVSVDMPEGTADEHAEYAVRWFPRQGGPETAEEALAVLKLSGADRDEFLVRYYDVASPLKGPPGASAILRYRHKNGSKKGEFTFKFRGAMPFPATPVASDWVCPLSGSRGGTDEVDVIVGANSQLSLGYSRSCESKADGQDPAVPPNLGATPKTCVNRMVRVKSGALKSEEWTFSNGEVLIELSRKGSNTSEVLAEFRRGVVAPLVQAGAHPITSSKTALGGDCP